MNFILLMCLSLGLTLDLYAEVVCKGAVLAKVENKRLCLGGLFFGFWQLLMLLVGVGFAHLIETIHQSERMEQFTWISSILVFAVIAGRMIRKAWKNEPINERREDILIHNTVLKFSVQMGLRTLVMGVTLGFLEVNLLHGILVMAIATVIVFMLGLYSGYRLGYVHKKIAYIIGALIYIASDVYLVGCYFLGMA